MTWHNKAPFKSNFILWRALRDRIPTEARIAKMGINAPSRCCCISPEEENIEHLFSTGAYAQEVWSMTCGPMGIQFKNLPMRQLLKNW